MSRAIAAAGAIALCCLIGTLAGALLRPMKGASEGCLTGAAAGIMLAAAAELVSSAMAMPGTKILVPAGMICGALLIGRVDAMGDRIGDALSLGRDARGALMLALAMAIHHFPEGAAAGVSLAAPEAAKTVTLGIALQNIPEAMIIVPPLIKAGAGRKKTAAICIASALSSVAGVFFGSLADRLSRAALPAALAFAGGTMLYVVMGTMLPASRTLGGRRATLLATAICAITLTAAR